MAKMSSRTNSEVGSKHWYNTIISRILGTGEFMTAHELTEEQRVTWGQQLMDDAQHLFEGYEEIQDSPRSMTFKPSEMAKALGINNPPLQ